ncbi:hypothetical protein F4824DRAFT_513211 [Ustulina deusta]|nr:hypothetical protein F4824DRAFT_513211 [Ustulina deusta]
MSVRIADLLPGKPGDPVSFYRGHQPVLWDAIELMAGYIILETAFSQSRGFTDVYRWWASTLSSDIPKGENWLHMLYLVSNFSTTDPRDVIYGLRGMIQSGDGGWLLDPHYGKTAVDVCQDSVEAAFLNFKNTNALLYVHGVEAPSWVPLWDRPMLFRNPFTFGQALPWRPAGESEPSYVETFFGNAMMESDEGKATLRASWSNILGDMARGVQSPPFDNRTSISAAVSFSFGFDEKCNPADEQLIFHNFAACLKCILDEEMYNKDIGPETTEECSDRIASSLGKPVWDFEYPEASFFAATGETKEKRIGCCIAPTQLGDVVFIHPLWQCPSSGVAARRGAVSHRGFCFAHGAMKGEMHDEAEVVVDIV